MQKQDWIWMPYPGHLIVARDCRFHLNTCVGDFIVSTVGDYLPDAPVREILARSRGISLEGKGDRRLADYLQQVGYEEVGAGRLFETMVFVAKKDEPNSCCPFRQADGVEVDARGYNDPHEAYCGHMEMCEKWSQRTKQNV